MASDKIKKSDLIGKFDLKAEIKSMKELLKVIEDFQDQVKDLASNRLDEVIGIDVATMKGIKELNTVKKEVIALEEEEIKLKQQQKKVKKQLKDLTDEEIAQKEKQRMLDAQRKKAIKDEIILADEEAGTLTKLLAQNRKLRKEREDLNLETKEGKKRVKEINKELDENNSIIQENADKLKKQKMNVGNYSDAMEGLEKITGGVSSKLSTMIGFLKDQAEAVKAAGENADAAGSKFKKFGAIAKGAGIGAVIAVLSTLAGGFGDSRAEADNMAEAMERFQRQVQVVSERLFKFLGGAFGEFKIGIDEVKLAWLKFMDLFEDQSGQISKLEADILKAKKANEGWSSSFEGMGEQMDSMDKKVDGSAEKFRRFADQLAVSDLKIIGYRQKIEELERISGDSTKTFNEQAEAQAKINKELDKIEKENIDREEIKRKQLLLKISKDLGDTNIRLSEEQQKNLLKNLDLLENSTIADELDPATYDEYIEAVTATKEAEIELQNQREENAKAGRETARDRFERELDFAIDAFDAQKTLNERLLQNDKLTIKEREAIAEQTREMADKAYKNQIDLLQKQIGDQLDLNDVLQEKDEETLRKRLEGYNADDIELGRILEVYRERIAVLQDVADIEKDNADKRIESNQAIAESEEAIREDDLALKIELMEKELEEERQIGKIRLEEEKKRLNDILAEKVKQLDETAEFEKQQAKETIIEKEELDAKILEIDTKTANEKKRLQEEVKANQEKLDREARLKTIKSTQETFGAIAKVWNESLDNRKAAIDSELQASKDQQSQLQEAARQGVLFADQSLAVEKKKQAELQKEQAKIAKRKQLIKATETALELMGSYAEGGSKTPFKDALGDISKLFSAIKGIQFFNDGTESVNGIDRGYDTVPAMLRPKERVMTVDQNKMMGNISNDEVASVIQAYNNGAFGSSLVPVVNTPEIKIDNSDVVKRLDSVEKAVKNIPVASVDHHALADYITNTIRTQNKIERKHYKANQIFK